MFRKYRLKKKLKKFCMDGEHVRGKYKVKVRDGDLRVLNMNALGICVVQLNSKKFHVHPGCDLKELLRLL